jgi:ligand-binding sensor domain-containing protein
MLKYFTITIFLQAILHTTSAQNIYNSTKNLQQQSYQAISWDIDQGVSLASVNCMLKDVNGFLWIGTSYGLNRFDGSHFINYLPDKNKNGTISDSHILSLVEDSLHNIWMGTFKGLTRYNIKADTFSNFLPPIDSTVLDPYTVPFWATSKEVFCIEMHSRITAYNIHSFERRVVIAHFDNDFGNLLRSAYSVLDEHNNCIWMYAKNGVLQVSLTGKQTAYTFPSIRKVKFDGYSMFIDNMCFDKQRNIIWQNTSEGLMQFSLSNKKFYRINEFDKLVNEQPINQGYYMPAGNIGLDRKGHVWIGTKPNGTLIYNPETHAIKQPLITNLQGNVLHRPPLYFDRDGIIWIGAGREIFQLNPINPVAVHYAADSAGTSLLSNNHIATMINGPQGRMWIGTWDGINIFDPLTGSFEVLREKDLPGFHGKKYYAAGDGFFLAHNLVESMGTRCFISNGYFYKKMQAYKS